MLKSIRSFLFDPYPHRSIAKYLVKRLTLGRYPWRVKIGAVERPHYAYCVYQGALLGKKLGYKRVSIIEFGVAGGNGLVNLEYHAQQCSESLGIDIEVYGFDTGKGLPEPLDYRDLPYHWKAGFFKMEPEKLRQRLRSAKLILGDIRETAHRFFLDHDPAPIAAVMLDFDFYSSTVNALRLFDVAEKYMLPRIFCYFDDIVGSEVDLFNDYTGERLAIHEFNAAHDNMKLSCAYHLLGHNVNEPWHNQVFILHRFKHSKYNQFISEDNQQQQIE